MIAVVDTGGANIGSVGNALDRLGQRWQLTFDHAVIAPADRVILPGVGAAKDSMARLRDHDLIELLRGLRQPTLGLCLGMQLLFAHSEEGDVDCLDIIDGGVQRMRPTARQRIPHMGWNHVRATDSSALLDAEPAPWFYFVHSYRAPPGKHVVAVSEHAGMVPAVVRRDNFIGCQFHPERSGPAGARLLKRFLELS